MMSMRLIALILSLFSPVLALADQAVDINTRDGVTVRLAIVAPSDPKGVAVLFTGGAGKLRIRKDGQLRRVVTFLSEPERCLERVDLSRFFRIRPAIEKKGTDYADFAM
jgi:hypothetical protein